MSTVCTVCRLPFAGAIDELLRTGRSASSVAADFDLSYDALARHKRNHLARATVATPEQDPDQDPLDELVNVLRVRALSGNRPSSEREYRLALAAQSDKRHAAPPKHDLESEPEWIELRSRMLAALEPYPEARTALSDALGDVA